MSITGPGSSPGTGIILPTRKDLLKSCLFEPFFFEMLIKTVIVPQIPVIYKYLGRWSVYIKHNFYFRLTCYISYWLIYYPLKYITRHLFVLFKQFYTEGRTFSLYFIQNVYLIFIKSVLFYSMYLATYIIIIPNNLLTLSQLHIIHVLYNFWTIHSLVAIVFIVLCLVKFR